MSETVENLVLRERTYQEKMDAWRTSYPQLAVWEEVNERGLLEIASDKRRLLVPVTSAALALITEHKPK
jgi:hypothetical protein